MVDAVGAATNRARLRLDYMVTKRKPQNLSRWIERNICLPEGLCAVPGPMKLYAYQRAIADALTDLAVERVTIVKAARIGFTSVLNAAIGYWCAEAPAPILLLLPTESDARDHIVSDLEPLFAESPALATIFAPDHVGQRGRPAKGLPARNTILSRRFAGGSLKICAARAPRNLRRHTVKILLIDEADAMEGSDEGSVLALAERRTLTFPDRKIIMGSTPLNADTSPVCRAYAASDMRVFEVSCPSCRGFVEIVWSMIEWPLNRPEEAAWRCPQCESLIDEKRKPSLVKKGRWRALRPEVKSHAGFRLNSLVSLLPHASWGALAKEFLAAKDDPATLKPFRNTVLALPWQREGDSVDDVALAAKVEDFSLENLPPEVLALTLGCDVQADRLECTFTGWAKDGTCFVLAHQVLFGPTVQETVWEDLDELLRQRWPHPLGGTLKLDAAAVDAGDGGMFDKVMKFCGFRPRVFAIKGVPGFGKPFFKASAVKNRPGQRLHLIGVDATKMQIFERLKAGRTIRFSNSLDSDYFEQLASERLIKKQALGRPVLRFERLPSRRAECLDALVYATAVHAAQSYVNYDKRARDLRGEKPLRHVETMPPIGLDDPPAPVPTSGLTVRTAAEIKAELRPSSLAAPKLSAADRWAKLNR